MATWDDVSVELKIKGLRTAVDRLTAERDSALLKLSRAAELLDEVIECHGDALSDALVAEIAVFTTNDQRGAEA